MEYSLKISKKSNIKQYLFQRGLALHRFLIIAFLLATQWLHLHRHEYDFPSCCRAFNMFVGLLTVILSLSDFSVCGCQPEAHSSHWSRKYLKQSHNSHVIKSTGYCSLNKSTFRLLDNIYSTRTMYCICGIDYRCSCSLYWRNMSPSIFGWLQKLTTICMASMYANIVLVGKLTVEEKWI